MKKYKETDEAWDISVRPGVKATWFYDFLCPQEKLIINGQIDFRHYMTVFFPIFQEKKHPIVCLVIKDNYYKVIKMQKQKNEKI